MPVVVLPLGAAGAAGGTGVPQPVVAAGWSLGPAIVPSARLVRVLAGAALAPPAPALWLAARNGVGFMFCCALALPAWLYGAAAGREAPPLAAGSDGWEIGAAAPAAGVAEADAAVGVAGLLCVPAPTRSFEVHPSASSRTKAIERIARCFTAVPPPRMRWFHST